MPEDSQTSPSAVFFSDDGSKLRIAFQTNPDRETANHALRQIRKTFGQYDQDVVLDLSNISRRDTNALAVAKRVTEIAERRNRAVEWHNAEGEVREILEPRTEKTAENRQTPQLRETLPEYVGEETLSFINHLKMLLGFIGGVVPALLKSILDPRRLRWRETLTYMNRCGTDAVPIVTLICLLMGVILAFQAYTQMSTFGNPILIADLVGRILCRELGPLMVGVICSGRAGASFAAEIGTMNVSEEVDALTTLGLDRYRFLVVPRLLALFIVMPFLTLLGDLAGLAGGLAVGVLHLDLTVIAYWNQTVQAVSTADVLQGIAKSAVFAVFIAGSGAWFGFRTTGGAQGVGASTTRAVVWGIFLVILVDAIMTMLFTQFGV